MRLSLAVVSCLALVGCLDMELDPCAPNHDDPPASAASATMATFSDATVGEPLSVYVQYVVEDEEHCSGDIGGTCKCNGVAPSPEAFEVVEVACDDDACDVQRVGDYVAGSREVVIVPRREMVSVRAQLVPATGYATSVTAVLTLRVGG